MGLQLSQQVNLYQSEFKVHRELVCAKNVQSALIVMLLVLSLVSLYDYKFDRDQQEYLLKLQSQNKTLQQTLDVAKQSAPSLVIDKKLRQQVEYYKKDVLSKQQVLNALSGQSFGNTVGFSGFFKGIAKQNISGLWLTNLNIRSGGKDIGITGSAYRAEMIPDFLNKLSNEKEFKGTAFQSFQVNRQKNPIRVDFYVDTKFDGSSNE